MKKLIIVALLVFTMSGMCLGDVDVSDMRDSLLLYCKCNENEDACDVANEIEINGDTFTCASEHSLTSDMNGVGRVEDCFTFTANTDWINCGQIDGTPTPSQITCTGLAYDPTDDTLWLSSYEDNKLYHISKPFEDGSYTLLGTVSLSYQPQGVAYDSSDNTLWYSADNDDSLQHIDKDGNVLGEIDVSAQVIFPCGLSYEAASDSLWVTELNDPCVHRYSAATGARAEGYCLHEATQIDGVCYDATDDSLYITTDGWTAAGIEYRLIKVDASDGSVDSDIYTVGYPEDLDIDDATGTLWMGADAGYHGGHPMGNRLYNFTKSGALLNGITNEFTIACWVKPNSLDGYNAIVGKRPSTASGSYQLLTQTSSDKVMFRVYDSSDGSYDEIVASAGLDDAVWQFVIGMYDGSYLYLYVDNASAATAVAHTGNVDQNYGQVQIGRTVYDTYGWAGEIDEVMIFDRALTSDERTYLYNSGYGRELDEPSSSSSSSSSGGYRARYR